MPTKPTIAVTVRASDTNYSGIGNDLDTTPTKIARSGAELALGYVPDSPLGSRPVSAQGVNYDDNVSDQYTEWVKLGSNTADVDAHIVETDSGGDINVIGVNCIDVRVFPNIGTDGIEVTTTGGSKGIEIIQEASSTDFGVAVIASVGTAAPGMYSETRTSVGLQLTHGSSAGLNTTPVVETGAVGPGIKLGSNTLESNDDSVGTIWTREQNSIDNVKMGMGGSAGYPIITKNAPCYARSNSVAFGLTGSVVDQSIGSTFTFKTDQVPQAAGEVLVTIWGRITLSSFQDNTVVLKVRDVTAGDVEICEIFIYTLEDSGATLTTIRQSATISDTYQLPAAGGRTFDLVWTGDTTGIGGTFTGFVEIQQLRG